MSLFKASQPALNALQQLTRKPHLMGFDRSETLHLFRHIMILSAVEADPMTIYTGVVLSPGSSPLFLHNARVCRYRQGATLFLWRCISSAMMWKQFSRRSVNSIGHTGQQHPNTMSMEIGSVSQKVYNRHVPSIE